MMQHRKLADERSIAPPRMCARGGLVDAMVEEEKENPQLDGICEAAAAPHDAIR